MSFCRKEVVASKFGNNVIAQATLPKYEDRLPHRKIQDKMKKMFELKISLLRFDLTRRAADAILSEYDAVLSKIRSASILCVDERQSVSKEKDARSGRLPHHLILFS